MKVVIFSLMFLAAASWCAPLTIASDIGELRAKAEKGDSEAQGLLGEKLPPTKDITEALKFLHKAAEQGSTAAQAAAQLFLASMYAAGNGVPKNSAEAVKWYRKAAENGVALAQYNLGVMYANGDGIPEDRAEAVKWYRKAAEQDFLPAQYNLGSAYQTGDGVPKDSAEAVRWYRKAAGQGYANAQASLGLAYSTGEGVPTKDSTEAVKWWQKAAEQGNAAAQHCLGFMYANGDGIPKDRAEAVKWWRKAAEQGIADAQAKLGAMYFEGDGVLKDSAEAVKWYRKAAEQGVASAQFLLGFAYQTGEGAPKDSAEAVRWYRKAADEGNTSAQFSLGLMYDNGDGVLKDSREAVTWYRKAAAQNHAGALCNLGVLYLKGIGVLKDEIEALAWYNLAAAAGSEIAVENRDALERQLGRDATLLAQQRSKVIAKEIVAFKDSRVVPSPFPPSTSGIEAEFPKSSGSGTIVSEQGYVLTAAHVVANAKKLTVVTAIGICEATIVRIDGSNDIAVLKLDGGPFVSLPISSSRGVRMGQTVATVGFPNIGIQGFSPKVTRGEISSLNGAADDPRSWQISVPVQPGNSGGPLLDENGNVIGVVVAKLGLKAAQVTGDVPQNVNYAVKSAYALALLEPYLDGKTHESVSAKKPEFEDMIAKAQRSVVLILAY